MTIKKKKKKKKADSQSYPSVQLQDSNGNLSLSCLKVYLYRLPKLIHANNNHSTRRFR